MRNNEALITIAVFDRVWEACLARGALNNAGIRALVPEEGLMRTRGGIFPHGSLQVTAADRDRAVAELRRLNMRVVWPAFDVGDLGNDGSAV
jgi:hypothetical protein